ISNFLISKEVKLKSKLYYQTFIEVFGFNRDSEPIIASGISLKNSFFPLKTSIVPHAPYSVSRELFAEIKKVTLTDDIQSIHNQESPGENDLFEKGTGSFADFFAKLAIAQNNDHGAGQNSISYHLPQMASDVNTLLVHNTFTGKEDLDFANSRHKKLFWCLCPNANLHIEDSLPDVDLLRNAGVKITLGTDSLASNRHLSILSEMQTLQKLKDCLFEDVLTWGTLNGAEFLGISNDYGSFSIGKTPGVLLVEGMLNEQIKDDTTIKRLF
ncbi:MAG: amidohydrolase family protein, partial [Bacteroidia bacterium]